MNMFGISGEEIMEQAWGFLDRVFTLFASLWFWPLILIGLSLLSVIVIAVLIKCSYENRILKSVNKLNKYFLSKPFITDENLVEFNLKMKKVPKVLRNAWQVYMLNREDEPTKYINVNTCIDKPLRTSSIEKNMSNFTVFSIFLMGLSFVGGLAYGILTRDQSTLAGVVGSILTALFVPIIIGIIYTVSILVFRAIKNDIYACMYENFPLYERNLTKAVSTLPSYVDYEILFTKKEIDEGIPILQQYLEKRDLVEQQELEKARENTMATEEYDFSDLGIDGSLVLERAMKECETFIRVRSRLQRESSTIETEKQKFEETYEQNVKDMQKKLQASSENLASLQEQLQNSTNRVESNYLRKQQADEMKKQEQLEKDIDELTSKFNDEQTTLNQQMEKCDKEIEDKRQFVEQAMLLEFKHYANTLYRALTEKATEIGNQRLLSLAQENADLKTLLTDLQGVGGEQASVEDNLIKNEEVTPENLYEMTNEDNENLEASRKMSDKMSKEEAKKSGEEQEEKVQVEGEQVKEEEREEENEKQQQENGEENKETDKTQEENKENENPVEENKELAQTQEETQTQEDAQKNTDNTPEKDEENEGQSDETPSVEEKQEETLNAEEEKQEEKKESDIEKLQKEIDEEHSKLSHEKREFENDLNNTISKIDEEEPFEDEEYEEEEYVGEPQEEERERRSRPSRRRDYEEEAPRRRRSLETSRRRDYEDEEEYEESEENDYAPRRSTRRPGVKSRRPSRKPPQRTRRTVTRRTEKPASELDELSAQMKKIVNSTKKD